MIRSSTLALILALAAPAALAQETPPATNGSSAGTPDTDTTDQSEEDWRRSQRKNSSDRDDPLSNPSTIGVGVNFPEPREIDRLPEDSRRHINRQRAEVIAEADLDNLDPQDIVYEPSEAAKSDPALMRDEQAAWQEVMGDLMGSAGQGGDAAGGQGDGTGQGEGQGQGQGTVILVGGGSGQGSPGSAGSTMGGGANQSAAEILRQMSGIAGSGSTGSGNAPQSGRQPGTGSAPSGDGMSGQPGGSDGQGDSQEGETSGNSDSTGEDGASDGGADGAGASEGDRAGAGSDDGGDGDAPGAEGGEPGGEDGESGGQPGSAPGSEGQSVNAQDMLGEMAGAETSGESAPVDSAESGAAEPGSGEDTSNASDAAPPSGSASPAPEETRNLWFEVIKRALGSSEDEAPVEPVSDVAEESASNTQSVEDIRARIAAAGRG